MGKVVANIECPKCGSRSGGKVYEDNSFFCHSCRISYKDIDKVGEGYNVNKEKKSGPFFTIEEINSYPFADLSHRGIKPETSQLYGVRQSFDEMTREPKHLFFPGGTGKGYKRKNRHVKEDMTIYGKYTGLFGQQLFPANGRFLIITEGEEDAMAAYQMILERSEKARPWSVVSLANGANTKFSREDWEYIASFENVLLMFDNDEPGRKAVEEFAEVFAAEVNLKVAAEYGEKDANDALKAGKEREFLKAIYNAKAYQPEKMEKGEDIAFEDVHKPIPKGVHVPTFPKLMGMMRGLRPEEMTMVLAPSGVGKSTFCRELVYSLLKQGKKVANIFLEESTTKTRQGLIALDNNVPLWKYRENPSAIPEEKARKSYDNLIANGRCHFVKHRGSLSDNSLLSLIKWYRMVEGVDFVVLDHISMVLSGRRSNNERVEIDGLLTDMAELVEATGVHLIVVSHIKRMMNKIYIKDKENDAEWMFIDLDAARGSGAFEQLTWNLITMEPEKTEIGERGRTRFNIRKNREVGAIGPCDIVRMNPVTGRMVAVDHHEREF